MGQKGVCFLGKLKIALSHAALQTNDREALRNEQESMNKSVPVEAW